MIIYDKSLLSLKLCSVYQNDKSMESQYIKLSCKEGVTHALISPIDFRFQFSSSEWKSFHVSQKKYKFEGMWKQESIWSCWDEKKVSISIGKQINCTKNEYLFWRAQIVNKKVLNLSAFSAVLFETTWQFLQKRVWKVLHLEQVFNFVALELSEAMTLSRGWIAFATRWEFNPTEVD